AGAPDPDRRIRRARAEQARHDLLSHVLPRLRIAEEGGDVDQQRVEQLDELLAVELKMVDVVVVALDPQRLHSLGDAALDARALVPREVKAAGLPDELEQAVERRVRL